MLALLRHSIKIVISLPCGGGRGPGVVMGVVGRVGGRLREVA